jgi:hypothetical protein
MDFQVWTHQEQRIGASAALPMLLVWVTLSCRKSGELQEDLC